MEYPEFQPEYLVEWKAPKKTQFVSRETSAVRQWPIHRVVSEFRFEGKEYGCTQAMYREIPITTLFAARKGLKKGLERQAVKSEMRFIYSVFQVT